MCSGTFGGVKERDLICVQSIDGMIMIFDNKQLVCCTQIGDFLLPSPLAYHQLTDSFILQSSSYSLRSYRYASIGAFYQQSTKQKVLGPSWSLNLGEEALEIIPVYRNQSTFDLLVLTESMLFVVSANGIIKKQKRFNYVPSGIHVYYNKKEESKSDQKIYPINCIISSFTHHLMIYEEFQLK